MRITIAFFGLVGCLLAPDASAAFQDAVPLGGMLSALAAPIAVIGAIYAICNWRPSEAKDDNGDAD